MKPKGISRCVDDLGRIVIPKELREVLDIDEAPIEIFVDEDSVILKKYQQRCLFCGTDVDVLEYKEKLICRACLDELKSK